MSIVCVHSKAETMNGPLYWFRGEKGTSVSGSRKTTMKTSHFCTTGILLVQFLEIKLLIPSPLVVDYIAQEVRYLP